MRLIIQPHVLSVHVKGFLHRLGIHWFCRGEVRKHEDVRVKNARSKVYPFTVFDGKDDT